MAPVIQTFSDVESLYLASAELFLAIGKSAIERRGQFTVALAGGSTPKTLYEKLSHSDKNKLDWKKTFFFFGDERNVAPTDDESNYRMARESFFAPLQIAENNIFRWQTELQDAAKTAAAYEQTIRKFFSLSAKDFPRFDLILLGMGDDGHTASLFPATAALTESEKIAVANYVEKLDANRLTLTFPAINNAENIIFLVTGEKKAPVLREIFDGKTPHERFPVQSVNPLDGKLYWMLDQAAAGKF